jgi:hypothetical protein
MSGRTGRKETVIMKSDRRNRMQALLRLVVWQLPEYPYPSDHPRELRRAPLDVRA